MINWNDTTLPNPATLSVKNKSQNLRKKMESGRTVQRNRWSTPLEEGTVAFSFLKEQFQIFKGVWKHYLKNGNDWFLIDLPVGGAQVLTQCQVKFVSDFTYKYRSIGSVAVQASIEFYEVETINELELGNLIDVGELTIAGEEDTIVAKFVNNTGLSSATTLKMQLRTVDNTVPVAYQFWDGTIGLTTNSFIPTKTLPITTQQETFVVNAYANISNSNPAPKPSQVLDYVAFSNSPLLSEFNPVASHPKHYWRVMDFTTCPNWNMPEINGTFRYPIKDNFRQIRMTGISKMANLILELEDNATMLGWVSGTVGLEINSNTLLSNFETTPAPSLSKCSLRRCKMQNNDALAAIDLSEYEFYSDTSTSSDPDLEISGNAALTTVTINGCPNVAVNHGRGNIDFHSNPSLTTINILGDSPFPFRATCNWTNSALDMSALKAVVDNLYGDSTYGANKIRVSGNPCWNSNALFPARSRTDIGISSITSTATDFTVTTSVSHGLTAGDYTVIAGASVSDYDGLHTVTASTSTTYTITSTINAGSSSGGTTSQEGEQDTAYVEETALANNFVWAA